MAACEVDPSSQSPPIPGVRHPAKAPVGVLHDAPAVRVTPKNQAAAVAGVPPRHGIAYSLKRMQYFGHYDINDGLVLLLPATVQSNHQGRRHAAGKVPGARNNQGWPPSLRHWSGCRIISVGL